MQAADARLFEAQGRFQRVAVVGFLAGIVALRKTDAFAVYKVCCGNYLNHRFKKLCKVRAPAEPLFSGWNCVPKKLPRESAALNGMP